MRNFLNVVAEGYANYIKESGLMPDDFCFVFPNKRAGTFFLRDLRYFLTKDISRSTKFSKDGIPDIDLSAGVPDSPLAFIAPEITTITDLTTRLSGRLVESRISLLFLLYKCYCETATERAGDSVIIPTFDSFRRWGETVLSDFNEIDMHIAEAEVLFKNLSDLKDITTTFLSPEQLKVIEDYFGFRMPDYNTDKFWLDFSDEFSLPGDEENSEDSKDSEGAEDSEGSKDSEGPKKKKSPSETRRKFVRIWKVLYPLYTRFNHAMKERGIATSGLTYRLSVETLEAGEENLATLLPHAKYVFIGFNALSGAEREIFSKFQSLESPLLDERLADFVWDAAGPLIAESTSAGNFVNHNIKNYPAPQWLLPYLKLADPGDHIPDIRAVAAPSKVAQVKIASELIDQLHSEVGDELFEAAEVAMVMPDQGLLLPLLYSLHPEIGDANLTMGYPLKLTSVGSFLSLLRHMQLMRRDSSQYLGYDYREVKNLLSHPYARLIIGDHRIERFCREFERRHISVVRDSHLREWLGKNGERLLMPLPAEASSIDVIHWIDTALRLVEECFVEQRGNTRKRSIEALHLAAWRDALQILIDSIREFDIRMSPSATISEAYRLLQGEVVAFEGKPLKGLQIMGLLETRALDFKEVFLTDVNDRILPMRSRKHSFLPNVIRYGYGLPPINYSEQIFSYYFYRLISRADRATLIYDNRTGVSTGGVSRYLMQLRYLYSRNKVQEIEYKYNPEASTAEKITVEKSDSLIKEVLRLTDPKFNAKGYRKNLSSSAMSSYLSCSLKFMLSNVEGLRDDTTEGYGVNNINYGNVLHEVMEKVYKPENTEKGKLLDPPAEITKEKIRRILADEGHLKTLIRRAMNRHHNNERDKEKLDAPLAPDVEIVAQSALIQIKAILNYDLTQAPFNLYGCEVEENFTYTTLNGRSVNMKLKIDRIDDMYCKDNEGALRFVDYKTGSAHIQADAIDDLFSGDYHASNLFQLMFYALMFNEYRRRNSRPPLDIKPIIYSAPHIVSNKEFKKNHFPKLAGEDVAFIEYDSEIMNEFRAQLDEKIEEIFDRDVPFEGKYSESGCTYCVFANLCRFGI